MIHQIILYRHMPIFTQPTTVTIINLSGKFKEFKNSEIISSHIYTGELVIKYNEKIWTFQVISIDEYNAIVALDPFFPTLIKNIIYPRIKKLPYGSLYVDMIESHPGSLCT